MKKLVIFTAEPDNFVPIELKKAGDGLGLTSTILDVTRTVLAEGDTSTISVVCGDAEKQEEVKVCTVEFCPETVVIPRLSEAHLDIKLGMLKRIELSGCFMLNDAASMSLCSDKLMSQIVLNSAGIKTPYSFTVPNDKDLEVIIADEEKKGKLKYPVIVKLLRGTHGVGVMKADSRGSLISMVQVLIKENLDFMIQEFMEHKQSARVIMIGDEVLAANLRGQPADKDEFRTNVHLGSKTEPYNPSEEEIALGRRIVELFKCKFCAIDYIIKEGEGGTKELIVLEVNGSPGLEGMQKDWPNLNLAQLVVQYCVGNQPAPVAVPQGAPTDVPVAIDTSMGAGEVTVEPAPEAVPAANPTPAADSLPADALAEIEPIVIHRIFEQAVEGRVDTGAKTSSLHADEVYFDESYAKFKRGDVVYRIPVTRIVKIKNIHAGDFSRRAVVRLDITIRGQRFNQVEFTLTSRVNMKYEVLIGRNILELLGLPVLIYKKDDVNANAPESEVEVEEE